MSAKSRARKFNKKRRVTDDSYAERYRKNSEAAKAARGQREAGTGESRGEQGSDAGSVDRLARAKAEHPAGRGLLAEFEKPIYENGVELIDVNSLYPAEGSLKEFGKTISEDRINEISLGDDGIYVSEGRISGIDKILINADYQEAVREEAASDSASSDGERGSEGSTGQSPSEQGPEPQEWTSPEAERSLAVTDAIWSAERTISEDSILHWVFFEAIVKDVPTHVATSTCFCAIGENHWKELGEI